MSRLPGGGGVFPAAAGGGDPPAAAGGGEVVGPAPGPAPGTTPPPPACHSPACLVGRRSSASVQWKPRPLCFSSSMMRIPGWL